MKLRPILLVLALAGCGLTSFDVSQDIPQQMLPGAPLGDIVPGIFTLDVSIDSQIKAQSTGPISSVNLKSMTLTITDPPGADWSFIQNVDVFMSSSKAGSGLPRVKVAFVSNPGAVGTMSFTPVAGVNLVPYINEGSNMSAEASGSAPATDITYNGRVVFRVNPL